MRIRQSYMGGVGVKYATLYPENISSHTCTIAERSQTWIVYGNSIRRMRITILPSNLHTLLAFSRRALILDLLWGQPSLSEMLFENPRGKRPLERLRCKWKDNMKTDSKQDMKWDLHSFRSGRDQWLFPVEMTIKPEYHKRLLSDEVTICVLRTPLHGVLYLRRLPAIHHSHDLEIRTQKLQASATCSWGILGYCEAYVCSVLPTFWEKYVGPIVKTQAVQETFFLDCLTLENSTDVVSKRR
jgi:hypothetical protein